MALRNINAILRFHSWEKSGLVLNLCNPPMLSKDKLKPTVFPHLIWRRSWIRNTKSYNCWNDRVLTTSLWPCLVTKPKTKILRLIYMRIITPQRGSPTRVNRIKFVSCLFRTFRHFVRKCSTKPKMPELNARIVLTRSLEWSVECNLLFVNRILHH